MEENLNLNTMEEVNEICEGTITNNSNTNKGLVITLGIGAAALLGTIVYKKVIKPRIKKDKQEFEDVIIDGVEVDSEEE